MDALFRGYSVSCPPVGPHRSPWPHSCTRDTTNIEGGARGARSALFAAVYSTYEVMFIFTPNQGGLEKTDPYGLLVRGGKWRSEFCTFSSRIERKGGEEKCRGHTERKGGKEMEGAVLSIRWARITGSRERRGPNLVARGYSVDRSTNGRRATTRHDVRQTCDRRATRRKKVAYDRKNWGKCFPYEKNISRFFRKNPPRTFSKDVTVDKIRRSSTFQTVC